MKKILHSKNILLHSVPSDKKYRMITETTYKRFLLICSMLCVLLIAFAEEIVIGSWNIRGNGHFEEQEIIQFSTYFVTNKSLDVLALQEVKLELLPKPGSNDIYKTIDSNNFLERFAQTLSKQTGTIWKFTSSAEYAIRKNIDEYTYCNKGLDNAVLYRADKLTVQDLYSGHPFYFDNFEKSNYKTNMNNTNILKIKNVSQTSVFYLINKHMPFKSKQKGWGPWDRDIQVLYRMYQILDSNAPIIICGDFNGDASELGTIFSDCFVGCRKPTSISTSIFNSAARYAHEYDHFILNIAATQQVVNEPSRYTSDPDIETGQIRYGHKSTTLEYFYEHISDHVPIFMSIDIGNF